MLRDNEWENNFRLARDVNAFVTAGQKQTTVGIVHLHTRSEIPLEDKGTVFFIFDIIC